MSDDAQFADPGASQDACDAAGSIDFATLAVGDEITLACPAGMRFGAPARLMVEAQGTPAAWCRVTSKEFNKATGALTAAVFEISDDIPDLEVTAFTQFDVSIWDFGGPLTVRQGFSTSGITFAVGVHELDVQSGKQFPIGSSVDLLATKRRTLAGFARVIYYSAETLRVKIEKAADITGNSPNEATDAAIANAGSGYAYGDTITLANGTVLTNISDTEPYDQVSKVEITTPGDWASLPSNPVSQVSTSGSGSAATFVITTAIEQGEVLVELIDRAPPGIPKNLKAGLEVADDGTHLAITVTKGAILDSTGAIELRLDSDITKLINADFAVGAGQGAQVLSANLAGTISSSAGNVTGTGTVFTSDFVDNSTTPYGQIRSFIRSGGNTRRIGTITDNTHLATGGTDLGVTNATYQRGGYVAAAVGAMSGWYVTLMRNDSTGDCDVGLASLNPSGVPDLESGYTYYATLGVLVAVSGAALTFFPTNGSLTVQSLTAVAMHLAPYDTTHMGGVLFKSGFNGSGQEITVYWSGGSGYTIGLSADATIGGTHSGTSSGTNTGDQTRASLGLDTSDSPQFAAINLGHASDTTIARVSAGVLSVEGNTIYAAGGTDVAIADGGTGASTATAGFNALSPLTTRGDLLTRDASNNVRVALGASGTIVSSDGTDVKFQTALTLGLAVLLASGSFSGAANLDMVLTGYTGYKKLVIEIINVIPATDNSNYRCQLSTDGGSTYDGGATNYKYTIMTQDDVAFGSLISTGTTIIHLLAPGTGLTANNVGNGSAEGGSVTVELAGQANAAIKPRIRFRGDYYSANDHPVHTTGVGLRNNAQDTDAIRFAFNAGNQSCDYRIWGYA